MHYIKLHQGGVAPIPSVLQSATTVKWQVNGQGSLKVKDNGQMVDGQSYTNKIVHENMVNK